MIPQRRPFRMSSDDWQIRVLVFLLMSVVAIAITCALVVAA